MVFITILLLCLTAPHFLCVDIKDDAFPIRTDYENEKTRLGGQAPPSYKKVYHRVIPGGAEHAEIVAENSPNSNSFSHSYSKHQSYGSIDSSKFSSFSKTNQNPSATLEHNRIHDKIKSDFDKKFGDKSTKKESLARHNAILSGIQNHHQNAMRMAMAPLGIENFGPVPKVYMLDSSSESEDNFPNFMASHLSMLRHMARVQNEQIKAFERMFMASSRNHGGSNIRRVSVSKINTD